jgi:hypothetical protein
LHDGNEIFIVIGPALKGNGNITFLLNRPSDRATKMKTIWNLLTAAKREYRNDSCDLQDFNSVRAAAKKSK